MKSACSIGFSVGETEVESGVYEEITVNRPYTGDFTRISRSMTPDSTAADKLTMSSQVSVIMDMFSQKHIIGLRYVVWMGVRWSITNVVAQPPRLILTLGGVYNG